MLYFMEYEPEKSPRNAKTEHTIGRKLLAYGLMEEYGKVYEVEQMKGEKPYFPKAPYIYFNISHTRGMVVCILSDKEIGIDIEYIRKADNSLICRICSEEEKEYILGKTNTDSEEEQKYILGKTNVDSEEERNIRFTRIWTLKESYIKAIGKGLAFSMKDISFSLQEAGKEIIITANVLGWNYKQFMLNGKYIVSICEKII